MLKLYLNIRMIFALCFAVVFSAALFSQQAAAQDSEMTDSSFDGQWLYETACQDCHGASGEGFYPFGISLRNAFVQNAPAQTIINVIQNGRYNRDKAYPDYSGMPAFDYIRAGEAQALVTYMKEELQE